MINKLKKQIDYADFLNTDLVSLDKNYATILLMKLQMCDEKETALTVNYISDGYADGFPVYDTATCPNCERIFEVYDEEHYRYCPSCGQKLKWGECNEE